MRCGDLQAPGIEELTLTSINGVLLERILKVNTCEARPFAPPSINEHCERSLRVDVLWKVLIPLSFLFVCGNCPDAEKKKKKKGLVVSHWRFCYDKT